MTGPCDLIVIGAGPAGMAAAATAIQGGLRVALVDAGSGLGGQFWRQPAPSGTDPAGVTEQETAKLHHDLATFHRLRSTIQQAAFTGELQLFLNHHVWTAGRTTPGDDPRFTVRAVDRSGGPGREREHIISSRCLVLATGAYDRQLPFPGWDLPGVLTAGGLQALLKASAVPGGGRIAIGGTGPFLLPVAAGLAHSDCRVVGVFESAPLRNWFNHPVPALRNIGKLTEGAGYRWALARRKVPYRTGAMIVAAHGGARVQAVTVADLSRDGRIKPGTERRVEVDAVGVGWGFTPQLELPMAVGCSLREDTDQSMVVEVDADQRTSIRGVYVAGEACGVGGSLLAVAEGRLAGATACVDLRAACGLPEKKIRRLHATISRLRGFAAAMHDAYPIPAGWSEVLADDTIVCRCEEVPYGGVQAAVEAGATDARQVKQLARVGMGWCQGRVCGFATDCLVAELNGRHMLSQPAERPVAAPITLGALAASPSTKDQ